MGLINTNVKNRVGYITLNRPEKRNAFSDKLIDSLHHAFSIMSEDIDVKVVVLQANGDIFCAGADLEYLKKLQSYTFEENLKDSNKLKELLHFIYSFQKPVIAKVQGHAIAGGCGIATVCDFVISSSSAKFGYTEVKIGFIPALVMIFLIRKIGESNATNLLLSGNLISSEEAKRIGLIHQVVSPDKLDNTVSDFAKQLISGNSGISMKLTKEMIKSIYNMDLTTALNYASKMNATARSTEDCKKGIDAFLKKEKIDWTD